jgi:hypothetical protein
LDNSYDVPFRLSPGQRQRWPVFFMSSAAGFAAVASVIRGAAACDSGRSGALARAGLRSDQETGLGPVAETWKCRTMRSVNAPTPNHGLCTPWSYMQVRQAKSRLVCISWFEPG